MYKIMGMLHYIPSGRTIKWWMIRSLDLPPGPSVGPVPRTTTNFHICWGSFYDLYSVWHEQNTACMSKEEMLAVIEEANNSGRIDEDCIVGSADVKSLYSSLDIDFAAEKVGEMFLESGIDAEVTNTKELGLYLGLSKDVGKAGVSSCNAPTALGQRVHSGADKPFLTRAKKRRTA